MIRHALVDVCPWVQETPEILDRWSIGHVFAEVGFDGPSPTHLWGRMPEIYRHTGDVTLPAETFLAEGFGIYILDGHLRCEGVLRFAVADAYAMLVVTGDLDVGELVQGLDTQLVVIGATRVQQTAWIDLSDAGFSVFRGPFETARWYQANDSVDKSLVFHRSPEGDALVHGDPRIEELRRALVAW